MSNIRPCKAHVAHSASYNYYLCVCVCVCVIVSCALTDSISHAVKKYPLVGFSWIIRWLLGKADIVTGLDAYY